MSGKIVIEVDAELEELLPIFMRSRADDMRRLDAALATNDFITMRLVGHSMKGSGGAYGFDEVGRIGDTMEVAALAGDATVVAQQLARLREHLANIEVRFV